MASINITHPDFSHVPKVDIDKLAGNVLDSLLSHIELPSIPMGSQLIDLSYFQNVADEIANVASCAELQLMVSKAMADINNQIDAIAAQLESIAPIMALLEIGTNPLAWIVRFVEAYLMPSLKPYLVYAAQLAALAEQAASIVATIENVASNLENCNINVPIGGNLLNKVQQGGIGNTTSSINIR